MASVGRKKPLLHLEHSPSSVSLQEKHLFFVPILHAFVLHSDTSREVSSEYKGKLPDLQYVQ